MKQTFASSYSAFIPYNGQLGAGELSKVAQQVIFSWGETD
jgi:hypothetical protein